MLLLGSVVIGMFIMFCRYCRYFVCEIVIKSFV